MAITLLDPQTALIVVDLQKGLMDAPFIHPIGDVVENARLLAKEFRRRGLPVVLVNVSGGAPGRTERPPRIRAFPEGGADLIPELDQQPGDLLVTKRTWGAFAGTDLEARLKALTVTGVVIAGVATATGVESTARQAYELGLNVALALDAMTDARREAHDYAIANIFPRLGETGSTQDILDQLELRSA